MCRLDTSEANISGQGTLSSEIRKFQKNTHSWAKHGQAKKKKKPFEFYVATIRGTLQQQKATLPCACATRKGALTPSLSVTDRSLTRIDQHSKHLFQTHVFDLFISLWCVNTGTLLKSSRGEKDKSLGMPRVDSTWLEHRSLGNPEQNLIMAMSRLGMIRAPKPRAAISLESPYALNQIKSTQTRSTQSVVSLDLKHSRLGTHTSIMSLGNSGGWLGSTQTRSNQ